MNPSVKSYITKDDEIYKEARNIVVQSQDAHICKLQRRLRIGYMKAVELMEELEKNGVVGPAVEGSPRKVLQSEDD